MIKIHCPPNRQVSLKPGKKDISILKYRLGTVVGRGYLEATLGKKKVEIPMSAPKIKLPICLSSQMAHPLTSPLGEAVRVS